MTWRATGTWSVAYEMTVSCQRPGVKSSVSLKIPDEPIVTSSAGGMCGVEVGPADAAGVGDGPSEGAGVESGVPRYVLVIRIRLPVVVPVTFTRPSVMTWPSIGPDSVSVRSTCGPAVGVADAPGDGKGSGTFTVTTNAVDSRCVSRSTATIWNVFSPCARVTSCCHAPAALATGS